MSNHSDELHKTLTYSITEFDKSIVFIASGALGISMAFIDKIVKLEIAKDKEFLLIAWYLFGSTIFLSLVTHFISVYAVRWAICNRPDQDNEDEAKEANYLVRELIWNLTIRGLNILMIITLFIGIILFLYFIQNNI
jgi:hypothetical protein